jgi:carboxyl-terminal processing protease
MILDLRGNGGGQLELGRCIAGAFLPAATPVVIERPVSGPIFLEKVLETREEPATTLPMVTLVDAGSASASEIVAGALQDHARSFIVGERSYGKGTVQGLTPLKHNSKILKAQTIARFYLPSGRTNQIEGIIPDITAYRVPNPTEDDKLAYREEDLYPNALPAVGTPWKQPRPQVIGKLEQCLSSGTAGKRFDKAQSEAVAPDYQLIVGEETLRCAVAAGAY